MFDIEKIKASALIKFPIFKGIILNAKYIIDYSLDTASTDGLNVYYNPNYMSGLDFDRQLFTLMHEICHIAFNHIGRLLGRNIKIWNYVADAVINGLLVKEGLIPPDGVILVDNSWKFDAEVLYDIYIKNNSDIDNNQVLNHNYWINKPVLTDENVENIKHPINEEELKKQIDKISKNSEEDIFKNNKENKKNLLKDLYNDINNVSKNLSNKSRNIDISPNEKTKNFLSWQNVLKKYTKRIQDWRFEDVEVEYGIINPTLKKYESMETEIIIDVSYSISDELIRNFLIQCIQLLSFSKIKIGFFDDKFYGFKSVNSKSQILSMPIPQGGGTDFDVAVNSFSKKKINKVILTDGYASNPKEYCDALWIIIGDGKINPPGGKVVYIDKSQLVSEQESIKTK